MSTFTNSLNLELVARGDFVGTWDTPENSNWDLVDAALGGITNIPVTNVNVILSQSQYKNNFITVTGALTGNVLLIFPPIARLYTVQNLTTNTSLFYVSFVVAGGLGNYAGISPSTPTDLMCDGSNMRPRNLPAIGTYWDTADSNSNWLNGFISATKPWLACDGTAFSSVVYPILTNILGGTTLPDSRGRFRAAYNAGTGRLTAGLTYGIDGNTILSGGGNYYNQITTAMLPAYTPTGSVSTPTGSVSTPTGSVSTPTGSVSTPTGTVDTPSGSVSVSTPAGTVTMNSLSIEAININVTGGGTPVLGGGGPQAGVGFTAPISFAGNAASGSFTGNAIGFHGDPATFTGNAQTFTGNPATFTGNAQTFTGNAQGGASQNFGTVPPSYIGGVTYIRAG